MVVSGVEICGTMAHVVFYSYYLLGFILSSEFDLGHCRYVLRRAPKESRRGGGSGRRSLEGQFCVYMTFTLHIQRIFQSYTALKQLGFNKIIEKRILYYKYWKWPCPMRSQSSCERHSAGLIWTRKEYLEWVMKYSCH